MRVKNNYVLRNIADEWLVIPISVDHGVNLETTIILNETGAFIWNALKNDIEISDLVKLLSAEYGVDPITAQDDVNVYVKQLKDNSLIEGEDQYGEY